MARPEKHTDGNSSPWSFMARRQTLMCEQVRARKRVFPFFGGFAVFSLARAGFALAVLATLSGCASTPAETPKAAAVVPAPPPPYVGLVEGSLGSSLAPAARTAANNAELAALASGERKTWRGDDGSYGYVAPAAGGGDCRDFTHTVYINGRPQVGNGKACRAGEGWKLS
jgi:surface antigen